MPPGLWVLLGLNAAAFLLHAWDKLAARSARRRVSEGRLLLASVPFTAPGAWLGVLLLRHKSSKPSYLIKLAMLTAVQVAAAGWAAARWG